MKAKLRFQIFYHGICNNLMKRSNQWWKKAKTWSHTNNTEHKKPTSAKYVERKEQELQYATTSKPTIWKEFLFLAMSVERSAGQGWYWGSTHVFQNDSLFCFKKKKKHKIIQQLFCRTRASLRLHKASRHQNCVWYLKIFEIYAIMETMISFSLKIRGDWINGWKRKKEILVFGSVHWIFQRDRAITAVISQKRRGQFCGAIHRGNDGNDCCPPRAGQGPSGRCHTLSPFWFCYTTTRVDCVCLKVFLLR